MTSIGNHPSLVERLREIQKESNKPFFVNLYRPLWPILGLLSLAFGAVARLHVMRRNNARRTRRQAVFFLSAPLRPVVVGVVLLQPNAPQCRDSRRLKQTRQSRGGLQSVEQGVPVKTDLNGQPCARAFFFRHPVFVKPTIIASRPIAPLGFQARPHPIRGNRGDGIERVLKGSSDVLKVIERTDGCQNMRRVGTLPPTRLEPFAFAAQLDQLVKKQSLGLPLKQPRAELGQDRIVKARRVERQGKGVFPINAAAHGVSGLEIGKTFGELKTSHQGQSPGGFGWPAIGGKERGEISVLVKRSQLVAKSDPRGAFAFAKGVASHASGFFWDRWNRSSFK